MKSSWKKEFGNGKCFGVDLLAKSVAIWEEYNGNPHTATGANLSYSEFLDGKSQRLVKENLGDDILEEIIKTIRKRVNNL